MELHIHKTKSALAYENLKSEIINGMIKPGERIIIQTISKKYGISDIPVREALKKLEADGFVQNTPHVGVVVTMPNFENQGELFEVRQLLECRAVELAACNISPSMLEELEQILEQMNQVCGNDVIAFSKLNDQFHDKIYAASGNRVLYKFIQQAWAMSPRTRSIFALVPGGARESLQQHKEIYAFLKEKDPAGAREAMRRHKEEGFRLLSGCRERLYSE
jgi:DNA-binding GntR family transcriptional regulator